MTSLELHAAGEQDVPLLTSMNQHLIVDQQGHQPAGRDRLEQRMHRWVTGATAYRVTVADRDGAVVAYTLWRDDDDGIHVRHFFVHRDHRRDGVGRAVFALLREQWPGRTLILDVLPHNGRALAFYRSLGFSEHSVVLRLENG